MRWFRLCGLSAPYGVSFLACHRTGQGGASANPVCPTFSRGQAASRRAHSPGVGGFARDASIVSDFSIFCNRGCYILQLTPGFLLCDSRSPPTMITPGCSGTCRCGKTYKQNNYTYLLTFNSAFIYIFIEIEYA